MGGSSFPSFGKSPAARKALGKPSLKQAMALKVPPSQAPRDTIMSGMPKQATSHTNRASMRGHRLGSKTVC